MYAFLEETSPELVCDYIRPSLPPQRWTAKNCQFLLELLTSAHKNHEVQCVLIFRAISSYVEYGRQQEPSDSLTNLTGLINFMDHLSESKELFETYLSNWSLEPSGEDNISIVTSTALERWKAKRNDNEGNRVTTNSVIYANYRWLI
jgi:hypothetical protein